MYTINNKQLIIFINNVYDVKVVDAKILQDGSDNIIWNITSKDQKRYVARVSKRELGNDIVFEAEWLRILKSEGVPVVSIISAKNGKAYANLFDRHAVTLFDFVTGQHLMVNTDTPPPLDATLNAAKALAQLHNVSKKHMVNLPRKRTIFSELERVIEHEIEMIKMMPGGENLVSEVKDILLWGKSQVCSQVLVHNDYRIGNLMFDEHNRVVAILDFDWACIGPAIKDVAHSLAEWSFQDGSNKHTEKILAVFLDAYNTVSDSLIVKDKKLYKWIAFSCLSDSCTYLIDRLLRNEIKSIPSSYMYQKYRYFYEMT